MQYHLLGYHSVTTRVRFGQTDRYGYTWHGHLPTFFEEGRAGFGRRYQLGTDTLLGHDVAIPMLELTVEYCRPSYEEDLLDIQLTLLRPALRLPGFVFLYRIFGGDRVEIARGRTRQVLISRSGGVPLVRAPGALVERLDAAWSDLARAPRWTDAAALTRSRILMGDEVTPVEPAEPAEPHPAHRKGHEHEDRA